MTIQTQQAQNQKMTNVTAIKNENKKSVKGRYLPLHKLIPNMITLTAMAAGMSSIKFAISERWEMAVVAIIIAACLDAFDGATARLLKAQSKLGAELDSLSDSLCFGVAPAFVIYLWSDSTMRFGWIASLVFAMACALRLARFNIAQDTNDKKNPLSKYFTGVPAPVGAMLALFPMVLSFQIDGSTNPEYVKILDMPQITYAWMVVVAAMMVSHIPTVSTKQIKLHPKMAVPVLGIFVMILAGLINETWPTLTFIGVIYLLSMPLAIKHHSKKVKEFSEEDTRHLVEINDDDDADIEE